MYPIISDNSFHESNLIYNNEYISKEPKSTLSPWKPYLKNLTEKQQLFFDLIRGNIPPLRELLAQPELLKAVVLKTDAALLKEARELVQNILNDINDNIQKAGADLTEAESFHFEVIIGDILALVPFLNPEEGMEMRIPLQIDGAWQMSTFKLESLELTPAWLGSPHTAYGLKPLSDNTPPLLLFKGTTYPTDKGFSISLLTDINPFASVGSYAFKLGKKKVRKWLSQNTQEGKNKALIYGKSLGGAQAWRTALYFPNYVSKVMAYGAPGFSSRDLKRLASTKKYEMTPDIHMIYQKNDSVSFFDKASSHVKYHELSLEKNRKGILAHACMYSTSENSMLRPNQTLDSPSWKRLGLTLGRKAIAIIAFPILLNLHVLYNMPSITSHITYEARELIKRRAWKLIDYAIIKLNS